MFMVVVVGGGECPACWAGMVGQCWKACISIPLVSVHRTSCQYPPQPRDAFLLAACMAAALLAAIDAGMVTCLVWPLTALRTVTVWRFISSPLVCSAVCAAMSGLWHTAPRIASDFCDSCASAKNYTTVAAISYDAAMTRAQAHITRLISNGWTVAAISRASKCSRSTLYRARSGDDITLTKIKAILAVRGYPPARPAAMNAPMRRNEN